MDDLSSLAHVLETLLGSAAWQPHEARALLRAGRALAREQGQPGAFDRRLFEGLTPLPPTPAVA